MYVAGKMLKMGDGYRQPGEPIPEAKDWSEHVRLVHLQSGAIKDVSSDEADRLLNEAKAKRLELEQNGLDQRIRKASAHLMGCKKNLDAAKESVAMHLALFDKALEQLRNLELKRSEIQVEHKKASAVVFEPTKEKPKSLIDEPPEILETADDSEPEEKPEAIEFDPQMVEAVEAKSYQELKKLAKDMGIEAGRAKKEELVSLIIEDLKKQQAAMA